MRILLLLTAALVGCSGDSKPADKPGDKPGDKAAEKPADKPAEPASTELNVYIWTNYHSPEAIKRFEEAHHAKVNIDLYDNNEVIEQKLQSGTAPYDIVVPTDYMITSLSKQDLLLPLDESKLPGLKNLDPNVDRLHVAGQPRFAVPYLWGTTGYAYRTDKITEKLDSWNAVFDPKYKGKIVMLDDIRECFGAALRTMGKTINDTDPADIEAAKKKLQDQKKLVAAYDSSDFAGKIQGGDGWVVQGYSGELAKVARDSGGKIVYVVPKEGATLAVDNLAIPRAAKHADLAYAFIEFMLQPEVAAETTNVTGYATANAAAKAQVKPELANDPAVYPSADLLKNADPIADLGDKMPALDAAWTEVKAE